MSFIDTYKDCTDGGIRWGIEPICKVLQFAPSTYYATKSRAMSARKIRDNELKLLIEKVYDDNYRVYGADKIWEELLREGVTVARCTVERLMRDLGIQGARRGRCWTKTTFPDELAKRPKDYVDRNFYSTAPNRLWVADITYVKTLAGWVYVAFVIDVFSRMVVGWKVSNSLETGLCLDALEQAITARGNTTDCIHHSDRGVQYLSIKYSERLGKNNIVASVGSKGDSFDNALAESFNGLYKWELIYRQDCWADAIDVEWATFNYIHWFNNKRLHGANGMVPPVELEVAYHAQVNKLKLASSQ